MEQKPEDRSKQDKATLKELEIKEDGRTVPEIMAEYRAKVEAQGGVQN